MKNSRKIISSLLASAMLFTGTACAQQQTKPAPVSTAQVASEERGIGGPGLWMVKDADTTIYMFGTVHVLPKDVDWLSGPISDALNSSQSIVTEIDMGDDMQGKMQNLVQTKGVLPQGTSLRSLLTPEQKASYETALGKLNVPPAAFDQFEPWFAGLTLSMLPLIQNGYSPESGVEKVLLEQAGDKPKMALETIEFQIGIFDQLPQKSQIAFLMDAADNIDDIKPTLDAMVAEWVKGDADRLGELMNEGLDDPELANQLLYSRNRNWANWIDERMDAPGTVFMAVGAGHLAGERSVQDMLKSDGLTVTRIQ
jgi:uncharacterized protein YbaP (TraB family)